MSKTCSVCGTSEGKLRACAGCTLKRYYCGTEHQRADWPRHKPECLAAPKSSAQGPKAKPVHTLPSGLYFHSRNQLHPLTTHFTVPARHWWRLDCAEGESVWRQAVKPRWLGGTGESETLADAAAPQLTRLLTDAGLLADRDEEDAVLAQANAFLHLSHFMESTAPLDAAKTAQLVRALYGAVQQALPARLREVEADLVAALRHQPGSAALCGTRVVRASGELAGMLSCIKPHGVSLFTEAELLRVKRALNLWTFSSCLGQELGIG